jgi:hypothetical protein
VDREKLLHDILTGDLDPEEDRVKKHCEEDPEFRQRLEELRAVTEQLDGDRDLQDQILEEARANRTAADRAQVREVLPPAERTTSASHPIPWRLAVGIALAASVMLLVAWSAGWIGDRESPRNGGLLIGSSEIEIIAPTGMVPEITRFEWSFDLRPGGWFEVHIFDGPSEGARELATSGELGSPGWEPSGEIRKRLPETIFWEVKAFALPRAVVGFSGRVRVEQKP